MPTEKQGVDKRIFGVKVTAKMYGRECPNASRRVLSFFKSLRADEPFFVYSFVLADYIKKSGS